MRASGWGSVCRAPTRARNGGNIRVEGQESSQQGVTISFPRTWEMSVQEPTWKVTARDQRYWRAMLYLRMRDCNVVRFTPRRAAAPFGPPTLPFASSNAFMIRSRSIISEA